MNGSSIVGSNMTESFVAISTKVAATEDIGRDFRLED